MGHRVRDSSENRALAFGIDGVRFQAGAVFWNLFWLAISGCAD